MAGAPERGRALWLHLKIEAVVAVTVVSAGAVVLAATDAAAAATRVPVGSTTVNLNQPADPFLGKITPTSTAYQIGMYAPQVSWPLIGLRAALVPSGHVVTYGSPVGQAQQAGLVYDDWNPLLGAGSGAHSQSCRPARTCCRSSVPAASRRRPRSSPSTATAPPAW